MEKDNKILLGAVLILLVAMVSFNFSSLTGNAATTSSGSGVTVSVTPTDVFFSKEDTTRTVTVKVRTDDKEIENYLYLFRSNGERVGNKVVISGCNKSYCKTTKENPSGMHTQVYQLSKNLLEGDYYFRVQRSRGSLLGSAYSREVFNSNMFSITHSAVNYPNYGN